MSTPRWKTLYGNAPRVIAHRGASGRLPEHTMEAYALAIAQGADLIEPDLVPTRDGVLVARHDRGLARSTDIASRPEFAGRARDSADGPDWWIDDFTWEELATLRAVQPWPGRTHAFDGRFRLPRLEEVIELAVRESDRLDRWIGVYPELKHPTDFAEAGLDVARLLIDALNGKGIEGRGASVWVQCFEPQPLRRVHYALGLPTFALYDDAACAAADFLDVVAREQHAELAGVAVPKGAARSFPALVATAHARRWQVHTWTYRDDLPVGPDEDVGAELTAAYGLGIDAVFADFPATAISVRDQLVPRDASL